MIRTVEEKYDHTVQFTLVRMGGAYGSVAVAWRAFAEFDLTADISSTSGMVSCQHLYSCLQIDIELVVVTTCQIP